MRYFQLSPSHRPVAAPIGHWRRAVIACCQAEPLSGCAWPQVAKAALCLAFHMNSPIASMFKRFQAMPLRNAAA